MGNICSYYVDGVCIVYNEAGTVRQYVKRIWHGSLLKKKEKFLGEAVHVWLGELVSWLAFCFGE